MGGNSTDLVQQSLPPEALAQHPDSVWTVLRIFIENLLEKQIDGAIVLLILLVIFVPKLVLLWFNSRGR